MILCSILDLIAFIYGYLDSQATSFPLSSQIMILQVLHGKKNIKIACNLSYKQELVPELFLHSSK